MATPRSMDMSVGTVFGGYRITSVLGRGGMSVVYGAEHVRLGRMVALKVMSQALAGDETFRERFNRESQLAAALDHPNIIPIYDAGEADGFLYIAMRHVEGCDLGTLIEEEGPLSLGQTLFYIEQAASALDQAHEQGLIHRDVKPANILIARPSDRVFLTDFGIVKQLSTRGLTKPAFFLGTYEYAAPEQIEGKDVDRRTDLYALGCILYECLSAEPPFKGDTEGSLVHAHLVEPPPRLSAKRPDVPLAVNDIIATAMAKRKEDRYPTCGDFVRAVRAVALGTSVGTPIAPAPATVHAAAVGSGLGPSNGGAPPPAMPPAGGGQDSRAPRTSGPRTVQVTGRRLAGVALALLLLIAAAVAAFLVLGGDDGNPGGGGAAAATTSSTTTTSTSTTQTSSLAAIVPGDVFKNCDPAPTRAGAEETVQCKNKTEATFFPNLELSFYNDSAALRKEYDQLRTANSLGTDFGRCDGVGWNGEAAWKHENGDQMGRRFCKFVDNKKTAAIFWTHEKLGEPDHRDMLAIAQTSALANDDLSNWYQFWRDRIGKCPRPGCKART